MITLMRSSHKTPHEFFLSALSYRSRAGSGRSHFRRFSGRNVNKRAIPILSVNQFQASATNESGVFAGVGRERHRWGASCIAHAHWQPLPPRSCVLRLRLVGDEALILLSEVFFHLWRHTGSFEVAFPQLAPPVAAFASARRLLA